MSGRNSDNVAGGYNVSSDEEEIAPRRAPLPPPPPAQFPAGVTMQTIAAAAEQINVANLGVMPFREFYTVQALFSGGGQLGNNWQPNERALALAETYGGSYFISDPPDQLKPDSPVFLATGPLAAQIRLAYYLAHGFGRGGELQAFDALRAASPLSLIAPVITAANPLNPRPQDAQGEWLVLVLGDVSAKLALPMEAVERGTGGGGAGGVAPAPPAQDANNAGGLELGAPLDAPGGAAPADVIAPPGAPVAPLFRATLAIARLNALILGYPATLSPFELNHFPLAVQDAVATISRLAAAFPGDDTSNLPEVQAAQSVIGSELARLAARRDGFAFAGQSSVETEAVYAALLAAPDLGSVQAPPDAYSINRAGLLYAMFQWDLMQLSRGLTTPIHKMSPSQALLGGHAGPEIGETPSVTGTRRLMTLYDEAEGDPGGQGALRFALPPSDLAGLTTPVQRLYDMLVSQLRHALHAPGGLPGSLDLASLFI